MSHIPSVVCELPETNRGFSDREGSITRSTRE